MSESGTDGALAIKYENVDWRNMNALIFIVMSIAYTGISAMIVKLQAAHWDDIRKSKSNMV